MTDELRNAIQQLRNISPQLNQVTDDANRVVQLIEKFLNDECSVGLPAMVPASKTAITEHAPKRATYTQVCLAYVRVEGKFRIAVVEEERIMNLDHEGQCDQEFAGPSRTIAWGSAPRDLKLSTFVQLPALVQAIADKSQAAARSTTEAAEAVQEIVGAISDGGDDEPADAEGSPSGRAGLTNEDRLRQQREMIVESRKYQAGIMAAQHAERNRRMAQRTDLPKG